MSLPLLGTTVLDLGDEPVALASRLLADLGADVIRVESVAGDWLRQRGPFVADEPGIERGLAHILYNAGKRSLAVDFERPEAWDLIRSLASRCDVVIAPLKRNGSVEAFLKTVGGTGSPTGVVEPVFRRGSHAEATDLIGIAAGGQLYLNGYSEEAPNHPAGNLAYKQLSLACALAAMSMVLEKAAARSPGCVEVSMQEAVMWTTIQSANENYWHWHKMSPSRRGLENVGGQTVFPARDGKYVSLYHHPPAFPAFARWYAEVTGDGRFTLPPWDDGFYRFEHATEISEITARLCASMDRDAIVAEGQKRGILAVPIQDVADIARDPHLRERNFFQRIWLEQLGAELEVMRAPFVSSAYSMEPKAPPALGEHSREVLRDLCGMNSQRIDALVAGGVVGALAQRVRA
ncbi:MAG: hypothetical protein C0506_10795 [Anaerolinea sp.]|nr:hypothetical protein [Anaerolinea sp.]